MGEVIDVVILVSFFFLGYGTCYLIEVRAGTIERWFNSFSRKKTQSSVSVVDANSNTIDFQNVGPGVKVESTKGGGVRISAEDGKGVHVHHLSIIDGKVQGDLNVSAKNGAILLSYKDGDTNENGEVDGFLIP